MPDPITTSGKDLFTHKKRKRNFGAHKEDGACKLIDELTNKQVNFSGHVFLIYF